MDISRKTTNKWPSEYTKKCSALLISKTMQIKCTVRCHLPFVRMAINENNNSKSTSQQMTRVGEDVEKKELSYPISGIANWCNLYGNSMRFFKKCKMQLLYHPEFPFWLSIQRN